MSGEMISFDVVIRATDQVTRSGYRVEHLLVRRMRSGKQRNDKSRTSDAILHVWILQHLRMFPPFPKPEFTPILECMNQRVFICFLSFSHAFLVKAAEPVNFSRDVLPILSENCLSCHGPDDSNRKADLRLDLREAATHENKEGIAALVPGSPEKSELFKRVISKDPDEIMPTPKSHKRPLNEKQKAILAQWITEGAPWGKHWAFEKPQKAPLPEKCDNPVDAFVYARLRQEGLTPSPEAEPHTLLRRLTLDLHGLPPNESEVDAFLSDRSTDAWERAVERLLASPHFGERMAMWWLDVARYADTDGFQSDSTRSNWPWRDWVTDAFNTNQPFDRFTIEQFAGDLLPNPSVSQRLATCFHRNHMTNGEGGRDPEESRVDYVIDRVNTTGTAFLGLTLGCTQCHNHKFDPITQKDYYSLTAFFNSIDETGAAGSGAKPFLETKSTHAQTALNEAAQTVQEYERAERNARHSAEQKFAKDLPAILKSTSSSFQEWSPLPAVTLASTEGTILTQSRDFIIHAAGPNPNQDEYRITSKTDLKRITGIKLEILPEVIEGKAVLSRGKSGEFIITDIKVQVRQSGKTEVRDILLKNAVADFSADKKPNGGYGDIKDTLDDDPRNGWSTKGAPQDAVHTAVFELAEPLVLDPDEELLVELRQRSTLGDANVAQYRLSVSDQLGATVKGLKPGPLQRITENSVTTESDLSADLRKQLFETYLEDYPPYIKSRNSLEKAKSQAAEFKTATGPLKVMVLEDQKEPRDTFVLIRGVWDKHGDKVAPGVPMSIAPWPEGAPANRLGLAQWVVSKDNPLTARVVVNQLWQLLFGNGLVRTPEDFGLQGERPTHPELLDWLAVEFMESGWNIKHLLTLIATSRVYRESSSITPEALDRDPANRLLARAPRYRLPSWMLRDSALRVSGLLNTSLGGPPSRPYQPKGVWEELFMGRFKYEPSLGSTQYRRTLYAFWRRSIAPTFLFDSAQRRVCEVRTNRTNTPLQALTLLNDETFREASRVLALRTISSAADAEARLTWLGKQILNRAPNREEMPSLQQTLNAALLHYRNHPEDAQKVLDSGQHVQPNESQMSEVAAYSIVASLLLNLDEAITHE